MKKSIFVAVTNYDFSENADHLKDSLSPFFSTYLIDSSSPSPPRSVDRIIPNLFYSGLWNEAVRISISSEAEWLLFIASDVQVPDPSILSRYMEEAMDDKRIGIYTPSLTTNSRTSFDYCRNRNTKGLRECHLIEGFFFLARTSILRPIYPVDTNANRYGWGVDVLACYHAYRNGFRVVVDDRVQIFHPAARHSISLNEAEKQFSQYLRNSKAWGFYKRTRIILKLKREASRVLSIFQR